MGVRAVAIVVAAALVAGACSSGGGDPEGQASIEDDAAALGGGSVTAGTGGEGDPLGQPSNTSPVRSSSVYAVTPLAEGEAPFTGLAAQDPSLLGRPVLAVKIDNVDAARPQAGINEADVVYEELVEGGLTRLLAVYHSRDPQVVGPVRSARSTDIALLMPLVTPLFSWSGANQQFADVLATIAVTDVGLEAHPELYERRADRAAPSDVFTSPAALRALTPATSLATPPPFSFRELGADPSPDARPVAGVDVDYGSTRVEMRWDEAAAGWLRSQNGSPHVDDAGVPVAPANVIVQEVDYTDTGLVDSNNVSVVEGRLDSGQGTMWFLSGGAALEGQWFKDNITAPTLYLDGQGERVLHARGTTWILLVPQGSVSLVDS